MFDVVEDMDILMVVVLMAIKDNMLAGLKQSEARNDCIYTMSHEKGEL